MTISITASACTHTGNAATTAFAVSDGGNGIYFAAASELTVTLRSGDTITAQTLGTHYTVAGAGSAAGIVTFLSAPASGVEIRIERNTPLTQSLSLTSGGSFSPTAIEGAVDKLTRITQDLLRGTSGGSGSGDVDDIPLTRTVSGAAWDANGLVVQNAGDAVDPTDLVTLQQAEILLSGAAGVTSVTAGSGLSGGTITTSGTISLNLANANNFTAQQTTAQATLTDAATIAWNLSAAQNAAVTLGGNRTLGNPTNLVPGGRYSLFVTQDATGGRTLAYGSDYVFLGGVTPTIATAANAVSRLDFVASGTKLYGTIATNASGGGSGDFLQAGTGAVTRTAQDKMREQIHVKDFGAVGDGTTDDTGALQAAITYAVSVGGEVLLGQGKFRITGATGLVIDESAMSLDDENTRISIIGEGAGASQIVHNGTGSAITYIGGTTDSGPHAYLRFEGFRIDGTLAGTQVGLTIDNAAWWTCTGVTFYELDDGVYGTDVLSCQFANCVFRGNKRGVTAFYSNFSRPNNITFLDCEFGSNTFYAATFTGPALVRFRGGAIEACGWSAHADFRGGIAMVNSGTEGAVGLICDGVYFEHNDQDADIYISDTTANCLHLITGCSFSRVSSTNFVTNNIKMECATGIVGQLVISGCGFKRFNSYSASASRLYVVTAGDAHRCVMTANQFMDSSETPAASNFQLFGMSGRLLTNNGVMLATSETGVMASTAAGTSGMVLTSNGSGSPPTFQTSSASAVIAGTVAIAQSAGTTRYYGISTNNATEYLTYIVAPRSGYLKNLYIYADTNPTGAETFTCTIRAAVADTALAVTIPGGNNTGNNTANSVFVAAGTLLSLKIVTSASAATISLLSWSVSFE